MQSKTLPNTFLPLPYLLPIIILIEGFVSIAVEILTIRQLLPVAGGSVLVTGLIIGIFLLFLALGYQRGGNIQNNAEQSLRKNFILASLWLGVGLSYFFVGMFFLAVESITGPHLIYPLITYLMLIIAPLIYLLGQTVPITMNLMRQNRSAGMIGGDTLSLSTIGSFLGATLTSFLLLAYLGVAQTLFITFMLLIGLFLILTKTKRELFKTISISIAIAIPVYFLNVQTEKTFFVLTNQYANYRIITNNQNHAAPQKIFIINDAFSSAINMHQEGFPYIEAIKKILFNDLKVTQANILVLGAGGFSLSAAGTHDNKFTYVDVDSQIKKAVIPKFTNHLNGQLIADDARHYLKVTHESFDVIVVDVFTDMKAIPAHLLTQEYMQLIQTRLNDTGLAVFNIIANPMFSDAYSKRIDNTIRSVFTNCMASPATYSNQPTNIIYTCNKKPSSKDQMVYSDNLNTSTSDSFSW